jgi:hypothetical protein
MPPPETVEKTESDVAEEAARAALRLVVPEPIPPLPVRWPGAGSSADRRRRRASARAPVAPAVQIARLVVGGALALFFVTVAAVALTGTHNRPLPQADLHSFEQRLTGYDHDVRAQLARLGPAGSVARARLRTREALAATALLADQIRGFRGPAAERLQAATRAQLRYLDAVGSTLTNPRSPLRGQLSARATAARTALAALDGRAPRSRPR